jgi:hypothetical protein
MAETFMGWNATQDVPQYSMGRTENQLPGLPLKVGDLVGMQSMLRYDGTRLPK